MHEQYTITEGYHGESIHIRGEAWHDESGIGVFTADPYDPQSHAYLTEFRDNVRQQVSNHFGLKVDCQMFESIGADDYHKVEDDGTLDRSKTSYEQVRLFGQKIEGIAPPDAEPGWNGPEAARVQPIHVRFSNGKQGIVTGHVWEDSRGSAMALLDYDFNDEIVPDIGANRGHTFQQVMDQLGVQRLELYMPNNDPPGMDKTYKWMDRNFNFAASAPETYQSIKERGLRYVAESERNHNLERLSLSPTNVPDDTIDR